MCLQCIDWNRLALAVSNNSSLPAARAGHRADGKAGLKGFAPKQRGIAEQGEPVGQVEVIPIRHYGSEGGFWINWAREGKWGRGGGEGTRDSPGTLARCGMSALYRTRYRRRLAAEPEHGESLPPERFSRRDLSVSNPDIWLGRTGKSKALEIYHLARLQRDEKEDRVVKLAASQGGYE